MGHRRFLPKDHPYRRNRKDFNGAIEKRLAPFGVDGVTDEEDYRGYQEMPPFGANVPLPILQEGDEPAYVQLNEALIVDARKDS